MTRAADWAGVALKPEMEAQLRSYTDWLQREAVVAGGLGPNEPGRVELRHIGDSLCLAKAWEATSSPERIVDVGSGVGLPGIPLAITHPGAEVSLLERSGRRCRLLRRACRVLRLTNVEVLQADAAMVERQWPWLVARAWTPPEQSHRYRRLLEPGGRAVIAASHTDRPAIPGYSTIEVPAAVLDSPAWILTMVRP